MKRVTLNFIIDLIAFIGFVLLTTTGVLMRYSLPPGSGHYSTIWGFDRHDWGGIHFWASLVFFLVLAVHLVLHWRWIVNVIRGRPRQGSGLRAGLGLVGMITVLALAIAPILAPVQRSVSVNQASPLSSHEYEGISVQGSMTLSQVEVNTGVPARHIIHALNLPGTISEEMSLGQLKREYGFEMNDVRAFIKAYKDQE